MWLEKEFKPVKHNFKKMTMLYPAHEVKYTQFVYTAGLSFWWEM